ncbi:hypothetical protein DSECCO2_487580 [anaerobic digester metagenome]
MPHCTSSHMKRMSFSLHRAATAVMYSCGSGNTPPSPWMHSSSTAAVFCDTAARRASMSPAGTVVKPSGRGAKPNLILSCPVAVKVARVRP